MYRHDLETAPALECIDRLVGNALAAEVGILSWPGVGESLVARRSARCSADHTRRADVHGTPNAVTLRGVEKLQRRVDVERFELCPVIARLEASRKYAAV